jgi:hypothetical protein
MSAETMKIPEPIMVPATSIVASVSVNALTKPADCSVLVSRSATVVVICSGWDAVWSAAGGNAGSGDARARKCAEYIRAKVTRDRCTGQTTHENTTAARWDARE